MAKVATLGTYVRTTKGKVICGVLLVWLFFFASSFVARGCDNTSFDPSTRISLCNYSLTLNSIIPGSSHRRPSIYLTRATAYVGLGDLDKAHADFRSAYYGARRIYGWDSSTTLDGVVAEDSPRWLKEFDRRIEKLGEESAPVLDAWQRALHDVKCSRLGTIPPECWKPESGKDSQGG